MRHALFPHLDDTIVAHEPKAKYASIAAEEIPYKPMKPYRLRRDSLASLGMRAG